jgi:hypothetical protein
VRRIMALAGDATERVKGNVWVHRWRLVVAGKNGKGRGRHEGVGLHPSKLMVVNSFWRRRPMTIYGIVRWEEREGQWQCVGALKAAGCRWWQQGRSAKKDSTMGFVIFRMGHVFGLQGQEVRFFLTLAV